MDQTASNFDIIQANLTHVDLIAPLFDSYRQFYKQAPDLAGAHQFILERLTNRDLHDYHNLPGCRRVFA